MYQIRNGKGEVIICHSIVMCVVTNVPTQAQSLRPELVGKSLCVGSAGKRLIKNQKERRINHGKDFSTDGKRYAR